MSLTSTSPAQPVMSLDHKRFIQFSIFAELNDLSGYGKRMEKINEFEKYSTIVENELLAYMVSQNYDIEISKPVKWTPGFGQVRSRITITGNIRKDAAPKQHTVSNSVINAGQVVTGYGCNNATAIPASQVDIYTKDLYTAISGLSNISIFRLEVNGIIYGLNGRTIPT